jgi:hypothetical protein
MRPPFRHLALLVLVAASLGCRAAASATATAVATQTAAQPPAVTASSTAAQPAASATPSPAAPPTIVPLPGDGQPPPGTLIVAGQEQIAGIGSYCWPTEMAGGQVVGLCADKLGIITPLEPLLVPAGPFTARFRLPLDQAPSVLSLNLMPAAGEPSQFPEDGTQAWEPKFDDQRDVPLALEPAIVLDLAPGLHVLALFVQWEGVGDVLYGFLVQVGQGPGGPAFTLPASCLPSSPAYSPYVDPGGRYCLQFPNHFRIGDVSLDRVNFYGPPLDQSIEPLFAALSLEVTGPAGGRSLAQVVDEFVQANTQGLPVTRRAIELGGEPAEVVEGVPGRLMSWQSFVIHAGSVYHLSLFPVDPGVPQAEPDAQSVWQAVSTSLTFLGP